MKKSLLRGAVPASRKLAIAVLALGATTPSWAFTTSDANTIMNSYNTAFYSVSGGNGYFKLTTAVTTRTDFWKQAEEIEMVADAWERTGNTTYRTMLTELCNGFSSYYGTSWSSNTFNDDIMWAVMAYSRAYKATGNTTFRTIAKSNFDMCYARAWDTGAGGLWWTTAKTSKNSCVNFPGAIAAYLLYETLGDSSYLTKSQGIFNWGKANLWNPATGQVWDSTTTTTPTSYNQGTFVGAANYLGDVASATLAANYTKNSMGSLLGAPYNERMLPNYDDNNDLGGFNGICYRWIAKFMGDRNLQSSYLSWLRANAQRGWDIRNSSGLAWSKLHTATPNTTMYSWGCTNAVVAMQVVPADTVTNAQYAVINRKSGKALHPSGGGTANGTALVQVPYSTSTNMRWAVEALTGSQYRLRKVTNTRYAEVNNSEMGDNKPYVIRDWLDGNNQKFTFTGNHGYYYSLISVHSGKAMTVLGASTADNAAIVQFTYNGGRNAQWQFRNP